MLRLFPAVVSLGIVAPLCSQTPAPLAFEVASIKQEDVKLPNQITGGTCHGSDALGQVGIPGNDRRFGKVPLRWRESKATHQ